MDLLNAVIQFGTNDFRLQRMGVPQGSPTSVFIANCAACYLEEKNWATACSRISARLNVRFHAYSLLRMRWVDDLFSVFVLPYAPSQDDIAYIDAEISSTYLPFGMKVENPDVFVGLQVLKLDDTVDLTHTKLQELGCGIHFTTVSRTVSEIELGCPKLPHAISNCPNKQL